MTRQRFVLLVLAILAVGSLWRMVSVERDKQRIAARYEEARQLISQLETDRATLNSELTTTRETVDAQATNMTSLQDELKTVQDQLGAAATELASLQQEYQTMREQNTSLLAQVASVTEENQRLEVRLSSLSELKLAIHDVKLRIRDERWAEWRERVRIAREEDQRQLVSGNRGFMVKDGVSTLAKNPRLHVHVLEPEAQ